MAPEACCADAALGAKRFGDKLGPAPIDKAGANRMSPAGISMFYGATDIDTAVAEIGAHSSHSWAVVGEFKAAEELRVVDLSNLPDLPSIFDTDEKAIERYDGVAFLHRFVKDLTLPIVLDGREHIDYVPTQVLTEYLRYSFPAPLHGLQFPSAQGSGHNVVLFFGPGSCAEQGNVGEHTWLVLTAGVVGHLGGDPGDCGGRPPHGGVPLPVGVDVEQ
ncbi:MAG: RES family NAD+ phosphorylase [Mycobacterium sp.]|uniref:RES family NAD+ phosphorylase n=1 Tax=Mycobacterium sp. TaxID=1785 RepID=UPI003F969ECB